MQLTKRLRGKDRRFTEPLRYLILLLSVGFVSGSFAVTQDVTVSVTGGDIQGVESEGITYFRGVPYAATTGGTNRFKGPQPVVPWVGTRDATELGNACFPGPPGGWGITSEESSEDCLFINVATPTERDTDEAQPIMVWIHGGGWQDGSGGGIYDPQYLVNDGDLIVVTINYRMGTFGFGWHEALNNTEPGGLKGNYAMRDMIKALQWVQDNAATIGGDASNVTIFGESAGGWSMCNLMASPHAAGLFDKTIMESGGCPAMTENDAQNVMQPVLDNLGCVGTDAEIRSCFENATVEEIQIASIGENLVNMTMAPVIEGDFLPQHPLRMIEQGLHNKGPVMLGTNHDEIPRLVFAGVVTSSESTSLMKTIFPKFWDRLYVKLHYNLMNYGTYSNMLGALQTDVFFRCQTRNVAGALYDNQDDNVYLYEFNPALIPGTAIHAIEMLYLFLNPTPNLPISYDLHGDMLERWTSFATNGAPTTDDWWEPTWFSYNTTTHNRYHLGGILDMEYPAIDRGCGTLDDISTVRYMEQPDEWMMVFGTPLLTLVEGLLGGFGGE